VEPVGDRRWLSLEDHVPVVAEDAWVAPGAILIGSVRLEARSSVWYATVLRGDGDAIEIGEESNVQDGCVLHTDPGFPIRLGRRISVGHSAVLHGCRVDDDVLIGMRSVIMNGAVVGSGSIVGAGALVPSGMEVPAGTLVAGVPARVLRDTTADERAAIEDNAAQYLKLTAEHSRRDSLPARHPHSTGQPAVRSNRSRGPHAG
jgi:carbonic anhydrase/acetyltransferase-like protein (isoleucine patch superfamily)